MRRNSKAPLDRRPDGLVTILLAGGQGTRLGALTVSEAKPAVPFREGRRIVDFVMANCVRSGLETLMVCTQWFPETLVQHLSRHWAAAFPRGLMFRYGPDLAGPGGYAGTAHAVFCNAEELDRMGAREVLILAGDHIYDMDYRRLVAAHRSAGLPVTVSALPVPLDEARDFGVFEAADSSQVLSFVEKPALPRAIANDPTHALASMGIYVFDWAWLREKLGKGATRVPIIPTDFGRDVLPLAVEAGEVGIFNPILPGQPKTAYWRDVGTTVALAAARADFSGAARPFPLPEFPSTLCAGTFPCPTQPTMKGIHP